MDLILLRHPRTDATGICYGRIDIPLAESAEDEVARAVLTTPAAPRILSSPAARCMVLARAIAENLALSVEEDARLAELNFGSWEGRPWHDIPRDQSDHWAEDPVRRAPPGGETFAELQDRVAAALRDTGPAIVITHAGPIRALWIAHRGMDFSTAFSRSVPHATPLPLVRQ